VKVKVAVNILWSPTGTIFDIDASLLGAIKRTKDQAGHAIIIYESMRVRLMRLCRLSSGFFGLDRTANVMGLRIVTHRMINLCITRSGLNLPL